MSAKIWRHLAMPTSATCGAKVDNDDIEEDLEEEEEEEEEMALTCCSSRPGLGGPPQGSRQGIFFFGGRSPK